MLTSSVYAWVSSSNFTLNIFYLLELGLSNIRERQNSDSLFMRGCLPLML